MTRAWLLLLGLALAAPATAQEEPDATDVVPAEEPQAAPADDASAAAPVAEPAPVEEAAAEEAPAEEPAEESSEDVASEESDAWHLYVGVDQVVNTLSVSSAGGELDTGMYRVRVGKRMFETVGIELHYGLDNSDDGPTDVETESYYGLYVVPTATLFEVLELAFPVGYGQTSLGDGSASDDFDSVAYGADLELPLRAFGDALPDLRLTGGGMVYYQKSDARLYGFNLGVRFDFTADGLGNPFAGIDLWPFGDDEEAPSE